MKKADIRDQIEQGKKEQREACGSGSWVIDHTVDGEIVSTTSTVAPKLYQDSTIDILVSPGLWRNIPARNVKSIEYLG